MIKQPSEVPIAAHRLSAGFPHNQNKLYMSAYPSVLSKDIDFNALLNI